MDIQTITREKLVPQKETVYVTPDGKEHKSEYEAKGHLALCRQVIEMGTVLERLFPGRTPAVAAALKDMTFWTRRFDVLIEIDKRINYVPRS